uniref:Obscurin like cytoskeletal adaptor 1 n=1 Tax=Bubo bubo TaxID=30461 RepID=A0A8C0EJU7_BUBBB
MPAGGEGAGWGRPASTIPHPQHPASSCLCSPFRQGSPGPGSSLQPWARLWVPQPLGVFLAYPRAFTVQSGTDAVLSCQITGNPQPSILWEKDKTPIKPSGRFHVEVLYCKPQDQGLYVCTASNTAGQTLSAVQLQVKGRSVPKHCRGRSGAGGVQAHLTPQHPSPALMHLFL